MMTTYAKELVHYWVYSGDYNDVVRYLWKVLSEEEWRRRKWGPIVLILFLNAAIAGGVFAHML